LGERRKKKRRREGKDPPTKGAWSASVGVGKRGGKVLVDAEAAHVVRSRVPAARREEKVRGHGRSPGIVRQEKGGEASSTRSLSGRGRTLEKPLLSPWIDETKR